MSKTETKTITSADANRAVTRLDELKNKLAEQEAELRNELTPVTAKFAERLSKLLAERDEVLGRIEQYTRGQVGNKGARSVKFDIGGRAGLRHVDVLDFADGADEDVVVGELVKSGLRRFVRSRKVVDISGLKTAIKQGLIEPDVVAQCQLVLHSEDRFWVETPADMVAKQLLSTGPAAEAE